MYTLNYAPYFLRKAKKLVKRNKLLERRIKTTLRRLQADPFDRNLGTHKVVSRQGRPAYSSSVTDDLRILWGFSHGEPTTLDLLDIGGHSGGKKVYR